MEGSFVGSLGDDDSSSAADTALRIFAYAGLVLNLGATLSSVLLLLAITSIPTAARRLYMTCSHGYPRKVFLHYSNNKESEAAAATEKESGTSSAPALPSSFPHFPRHRHTGVERFDPSCAQET